MCLDGALIDHEIGVAAQTYKRRGFACGESETDISHIPREGKPNGKLAIKKPGKGMPVRSDATLKNLRNVRLSRFPRFPSHLAFSRGKHYD
jgi:hypothetical protein